MQRTGINKISFKVVQQFLLALTLLLGLGIRLYDLKDPPLDFHAVRQLRSALIAREVYYQISPGFTQEQKDKMASLAALEEYEPAILEQIVGFTDYLLGSEEFWVGRIYSSIFWVIGGIALYWLARRLTSFYPALAGLAFYLFLPFSVIAGRSFQPEPWMVMWILFSACAFYRWSEKPNWKWAVISGIIGGIAVLVKAVAGFFVVGILVMIVIYNLGFRKIFRSPQTWVMGGLTVIPTLAFYLIFHAQRTGEYISFWTVSLSGLILTSNFYADWLAMVQGLTGTTMLLLGLIGVVLAIRQFRWILVGLWIGYFLYGLVFPYQYITHEYYQLPLVPLVALSLCSLADIVFISIKQQHRFWQAIAIGILLFATVYSLWVSRSILYANDYKNEPESWRRVGEAIPDDKPFIALTSDYGMRLRYYGLKVPAIWPSIADLNLQSLRGNEPMDYKTYFVEVTSGKDYFLVTAFTELENQPQLKDLLYSKYKINKEGNGFIVFDLTALK